MASIGPKRPDGTYRARYRDASGKEHARHFARKVDAQRWLDQVTASIVRGDYVDPREARVSLRTYATSWRSTLVHNVELKRKLVRVVSFEVEKPLEHHHAVLPVVGVDHHARADDPSLWLHAHADMRFSDDGEELVQSSVKLKFKRVDRRHDAPSTG